MIFTCCEQLLTAVFLRDPKKKKKNEIIKITPLSRVCSEGRVSLSCSSVVFGFLSLLFVVCVLCVVCQLSFVIPIFIWHHPPSCHSSATHLFQSSPYYPPCEQRIAAAA